VLAGLSPVLGSGAVAATHQVAGDGGIHQAHHKHHLKKSAIRFSHEVVVDEQRSGFEPDVLVDGKDRMYTSVPNGSSQGTSFVWGSRDHGNSFQLVPGSVLHGKPKTCAGGGDTELQLDKANNLFLSDLQNLTNLSNSVSKDQGKNWDTTCIGAVNTPVDRMWYAVQGTLGKPGFAIYEEYDAIEQGAGSGGIGSNQLVEEVSGDGTTFVPVQNPDFTGDCVGGGALNCVSDDEGISGNQLVTPSGEVVIAHSSADGNRVVVSYSKPKLQRSNGSIVSASAHWTNVTVNRSLCPDKSGEAPGICGSTEFATVARDTSGTLYVSFSSAKFGKNGNQLSPYNVYVVHSNNGGKTWSKPTRASRGGSNSFSWITAGSRGRTAMAWYHADQRRGKGGFTFDDLGHAEFSVQEAESIHSKAKHPKYKVKTVSEHPIKYGPICTHGLDCTVSGGDRSLGDFLEVSHDRRGALALSYVNDTSNTYTQGPTGFAENGPPVIVRQVHGTSLVKGKGNRSGFIKGAGKGPGLAMKKIGDRKKDDVYSANSARKPAGPAMDLRGASLKTAKNHKALIAHMRLRSLKSLAMPNGVGGSTGEWILRFTTYNPHTLGNGHVYYAGMESDSGGKPTFYDGDTAPPAQSVQLSQNFSSSHTTKGSYNPKTGKIRIVVPFKDVTGVKHHAMLYSATAFTGSTQAPLSVPNPSGVQGQINQLDATPPFDYRVPKKAITAKAAAASTSTSGSTAQWVIGGVAGGVGMVLLAVGGVFALRRRRESARRRLVLR
jgi:MYXO-CTERM domain-containing protein